MSVRNSKALIGALFLQYCAYGVFYILDEFKKLSPPMYRPVQEQGEGGAEEIEENKEGEDGKPQPKPNKLMAFLS